MDQVNTPEQMTQRIAKLEEALTTVLTVLYFEPSQTSVSDLRAAANYYECNNLTEEAKTITTVADAMEILIQK